MNWFISLLYWLINNPHRHLKSNQPFEDWCSLNYECYSIHLHNTDCSIQQSAAKTWNEFGCYSCIRPSLQKNTLSSTQRTEINCYASRTSSHGRYWTCYDTLLNAEHHIFSRFIFVWPFCWHHGISAIYRSHYLEEGLLYMGREWRVTCALSMNVWKSVSNSWKKKWRRNME